uniref:hypothetical protein n=1 Tax=Sphingomonas sp. TaxID=28214 RepID=UPI0025FABBC7|nr:hypothetical protein [Sphingomonas sp.]
MDTETEVWPPAPKDANAKCLTKQSQQNKGSRAKLPCGLFSLLCSGIGIVILFIAYLNGELQHWAPSFFDQSRPFSNYWFNNLRDWFTTEILCGWVLVVLFIGGLVLGGFSWRSWMGKIGIFMAVSTIGWGLLWFSGLIY